MAKKRRVGPPVSSDAPGTPSTRQLNPISFAIGLLGGAIVYVSYYPSDSVAVERGDALWFASLAIVIATIVWAASGWTHSSSGDTGDAKSGQGELRSSRFLDAAVWLLAGWMMWAAFANSPPGNLRMATNEAWFWVAAAAMFTSARRLMAGINARRAMFVLLVVCGLGLAVHGLHQYFYSLPANRAQYERDPQGVLEMAGVDAPPGSAERMVFENRLFDGGPTATFALANSLAAVLLCGVVVSIGVLRFHWRKLRPQERATWGLVALVCAGCLMGARSRSAAFAMLFGVSLIFVVSSRWRNTKALVLGLGGVSVLGVVGAIFIAILGNREWFEEAAPSLAFRFQYWRSTWQMVLDHPLMGAGPGNFQSMYERYREASANEQIADPHNLFFETLGSGGFVALGLLLLAMLSGFLLIVQRWGISIKDKKDATERDDDARWLWLGAILSLLMIWLIGWASRHVPDVGASMFVLPAALIAAIVLWPSVAKLTSRDLDSIVGVALLSLALHLMVSGGWTVPGVAILVWICAATLTRVEYRPGRRQISSQLLFGVVGIALIIAIYTTSLRPVEAQKRLMATSAMAQKSGQFGKARISLEQAVESEPWSPDAVLWLADLYRWKLVAGPDRADYREQWESCLAEAKRRGGDDPAMYRMIGTQQLHVFQRYGAEGDLAGAEETILLATQWSPANQWLIAQLAVVAAARGDRESARILRQRALELSKLGGNIERSLSRQQIYVARPVGKMADQGPIRQPADQLLTEPSIP